MDTIMSASHEHEHKHKHKQEARAGDQEASAKRSKASFGFPGRHQNGASAIYRQDRGYRDNSLFLERLFNHDDNAIVFTRPMQLGKTTLFSLADELFSMNKTSNVDADLRYSPGEGDRNKWFVLRLDFGVVSAEMEDDTKDTTWEDICKCIDKATTSAIKPKVIFLLLSNKQLNENYERVSMGVKILDQPIGTVIHNLSTAVQLSPQGRLLILVDEYDQPIREGLLHLIPDHGRTLYETVVAKIRLLFRSYFAFFRAVKVSLEQLEHAKIFLTGITPIGIKERSGLTIVSVTFEEFMADAVGLTDADVRAMLGKIHTYDPFAEGELELAFQKIKYNFNNLRFPGGSKLYHTALVNALMNRLLRSRSDRTAFLHDVPLPGSLRREPIPSSVFNVLQNARNLRHVVNKLAERREVKGYELNEDLSLEHLLREDIHINDYLTLLVHLVVVSASSKTNPTFAITSDFYREKLLEPLLRTVQASLETLTSLTTTEDLYAKGEGILMDFATSISKNNMARLISWASSDTHNHILELQFQSHVVTEAHGILKGSAQTTQEDILPLTGKRTDVTFSSATCVVILELKQLQNAPTPAYITKAHEHLSEYVQTRRAMEAGANKRPVAGFVIMMYDDGAAYVVEKLRNDNS